MLRVKGDITQRLVYHAWLDIWGKDLNRKYASDFEIYGEKAQDITNAEVDIFVSLK